jgi:hypothetical protein
MNFDRLRFVAERAELGEARSHLRGDDPRAPRRLPRVLRPPRPRVVTEFNYRLGSRDQAHIFVGVATASREDAAGRAVASPFGDRRSLRRDGEAARAAHGRRPRARRAARAALPVRVERPGALAAVPDAVGSRWNISLFPYRNHGADFGRVLAAFEVPDEQLSEVPRVPRSARLSVLAGFGNEAYRLFLNGWRGSRNCTGRVLWLVGPLGDAPGRWNYLRLMASVIDRAVKALPRGPARGHPRATVPPATDDGFPVVLVVRSDREASAGRRVTERRASRGRMTASCFCSRRRAA